MLEQKKKIKEEVNRAAQIVKEVHQSVNSFEIQNKNLEARIVSDPDRLANRIKELRQELEKHKIAIGEYNSMDCVLYQQLDILKQHHKDVNKMIKLEKEVVSRKDIWKRFRDEMRKLTTQAKQLEESYKQKKPEEEMLIKKINLLNNKRIELEKERTQELLELDQKAIQVEEKLNAVRAKQDEIEKIKESCQEVQEQIETLFKEHQKVVNEGNEKRQQLERVIDTYFNNIKNFINSVR